MKKLIFRLSDEDFTAFRVKLAREGRTAQDVLAKAVADYQDPMTQATDDLYAACKARIKADEDWDQGTEHWHRAVLVADAMMRAALDKAEGRN